MPVTNEDTQFGFGTEFGFDTFFKFPNDSNTNLNLLLGMVSDLYPTGRVWNLNEKSDFNKFHTAINKSFSDLIDFSSSLIDSMIPDNENFDSEDATWLEYNLGLTTNESLPLSLRKSNLLTKLAYPNNRTARQHYLYIEKVLNDYGFDVKVYENLFYNLDGSVYYVPPQDVILTSPGITQHGGDTQHGGATQHGFGSYSVIANSMFDEEYNIGGLQNLWATFYIGGATFGDIAIIPESRKTEFRELVLKLKPAHLIAYTLIDFQ